MTQLDTVPSSNPPEHSSQPWRNELNIIFKSTECKPAGACHNQSHDWSASVDIIGSSTSEWPGVGDGLHSRPRYIVSGSFWVIRLRRIVQATHPAGSKDVKTTVCVRRFQAYAVRAQQGKVVSCTSNKRKAFHISSTSAPIEACEPERAKTTHPVRMIHVAGPQNLPSGFP
jgi:hypothetical protein